MLLIRSATLGVGSPALVVVREALVFGSDSPVFGTPRFASEIFGA